MLVSNPGPNLYALGLHDLQIRQCCDNLSARHDCWDQFHTCKSSDVALHATLQLSAAWHELHKLMKM
jgi:hypothetical protein